MFSAPASTMILGEHAVLYGHSAIVSAIDQRLFVTCAYLNDPILMIHSPTIGSITLSWKEFDNMPMMELKRHSMRFILLAIKACDMTKFDGISITIKSDFSHQVGLGSSAAVTVAMVAELMRLKKSIIDRHDIYRIALNIVRHIQGNASGSDIAASIQGGIVHYSPQPFFIEKLSTPLALCLIYSGYKTPTAEVIDKVSRAYKETPLFYDKTFKQIAWLVKEGKQALLAKDRYKLGEIFKQHQKLQAQLGVSDQTLDQILTILEADKKIYAAKISGAGLGDSVISLGQVSDQSIHALKKLSSNIQLLQVKTTNVGLRDETSISQ